MLGKSFIVLARYVEHSLQYYLQHLESFGSPAFQLGLKLKLPSLVIVIGVFEARVAFPPLKVTLKSEISIQVGVLHPVTEKISSSNVRSILRLLSEILVPVTLENCA